MSTPAPQFEWKRWQKAAFRFAFVVFVLLALPLDWKFYRTLVTADWNHFQDLFQLTAYLPHFLPAKLVPPWGLASFAEVGAVLMIALVAAAVWTGLDRARTNYDAAYYWLRVLLRYRLALGLIGFGVIKLFPAQFPAPTLSELHTRYGDFLPWKIYYLTTGIAVAHYKQSIGLLEIVAAALLLWRPAATIGAGLAAAILTNVVLVNFAYSIGEHVYATMLLIFSVAILAHDTPRLYDLLVRERPARADTFTPTWSGGARWVRQGIRVLFSGFAVLYGATTYAGYHRDRWPLPSPSGVKELTGYYNVREFRLNGVTHPYSLTDPARWQNVVFEEWNTVSVRLARPAPIDPTRPVVGSIRWSARDYEAAGNGGRFFYSYKAEDETHSLHLQGKNAPGESLDLTYAVASDGAVTLSGKTQRGELLEAVLEKTDKKYLLQEGRRKPLSVY